MTGSLSRRHFLMQSAAAGGVAALSPAGLGTRLVAPPETLRVLSIGVIGSIGGVDRRQIASHPNARIVGLCDVNSESLAKAGEEHPDAFRVADYREAFAEHGDAFDAVIVATPDHSHAPILLTAMAAGKHVYGQKPLVHQLEELALVERALAARPQLVTQLGNQRMVFQGRRAATEVLRQGQLGKAIAAHVWVGSPNHPAYFNLDHDLQPPTEPPAHIDWDLWLGPAGAAPYREKIAPQVWRSWWEYGTNGLGDWGCHVLDVLFHAYPELVSPFAVLTHSPAPADEHFHADPCHSTVSYRVPADGGRFAADVFPIHFSDSGQGPSRAALGLPAGAWPDDNMTVVVCEGGVLALGAGGRCEVWREGKVADGLELPGLPDFPKQQHWHAWVERCLGRQAAPDSHFADALRMTEACLLPVKAARFPGVELRWDRAALAFPGHEEASATLVRREYREGFAPPAVD